MDLRKMEVLEEETVEVVDKDLSLVVEEMIFVEDKVKYKVVEVDMIVLEVDTKILASMLDAMVVY